MCVSRRLHREAPDYIYGRHCFNFGNGVEAVVPFLHDLSPSTLQTLRCLTVRKAHTYPSATDDVFWGATCDFLRSFREDGPKLNHLRIVLQGGKPTADWDGPADLSVSDLRLLYATHNECLAWAKPLGEARAEMRPMGEIGDMGSEERVFAAFSASIETTLVEFLRDLGMPATRRMVGVE